MAGGTSGAVQTRLPDSVNNVFQNPPKAAMVIEGDFVPGVATVKAKPAPTTASSRSRRSTAPAQRSRSAGDTIVTFRDNPAIEAFVKFLATPAGGRGLGEARRLRDRQPQHAGERLPGCDLPVRPRPPVAKAKNVVFDMSDEQPGSFGATVGQGEWGLFQDFLRNPTDVTGIQKKLESAATAAYKKGK